MTFHRHLRRPGSYYEVLVSRGVESVPKVTLKVAQRSVHLPPLGIDGHLTFKACINLALMAKSMCAEMDREGSLYEDFNNHWV